jgi:hypothetical protein
MYELERQVGKEFVAGIVAIMLAVLLSIMFAGCNRGDVKATMVLADQPAPHDGFNIGPDIWVTAGEPVKLDGAVIWIRNVDPNSLMTGSE